MVIAPESSGSATLKPAMCRVRSTLSFLAICGLTALDPASALDGPTVVTARQASPERTPLRGMVVSCPGMGRIWGSEAMRASLAELTTLGVDSVAIHPYAGVRRDGSVRFHPAAQADYLKRAVELARQAGVRLFWKPHLAYWGSFGWRGEIEYGDDQDAWRRFFDGYRAFIVDQAAFAERSGIDLFAVGVELEGTAGYADEWRSIVAAVRKVYSGRITYVANWSSLGAVGFWDAVDLIGVHAYFPLSSSDSPTEDELCAGWQRPLADLEAMSRSHGKPVLVGEIGYNRSPIAASEPWDYGVTDTPETRRLRQRLIEVALDRLADEPWIEGIFWWKWMPGDRWRGNFSMRDEEAKTALRRFWGRPPGTATAVCPPVAISTAE